MRNVLHGSVPLFITRCANDCRQHLKSENLKYTNMRLTDELRVFCHLDGISTRDIGARTFLHGRSLYVFQTNFDCMLLLVTARDHLLFGAHVAC